MSPTAELEHRHRRWTWVIVGGLACVQFALGVHSAWNKTPAYDEPAHLFAGYCLLKTGDARMAPENPPLPRLLAAAPLLLAELCMPDVEQPNSLLADAWRRGAKYQIARGWLYQSGNDPERIMHLARTPMLMLAALGGVMLFVVTRASLGRSAGFIVQVLWVFSPSVLAHGRLVSADLPAAVFFLCATLSFHRLTGTVSIRNMLVAAISVAALFLTKFSAGLFVPVAVILMFIRFSGPYGLSVNFGRRYGRHIPADQRLARLGVMSVTCLVLALTTALSIWAAYGFRFRGARDGGFHYAHPGRTSIEIEETQAWDALCTTATGEKPLVRKIIKWASDSRLLPEPYLFGLAYTLKNTEGLEAYLNGEIRTGGWWYYFPFVFLVKTSPVILVFCGLGIAGWIQLIRSRGWTEPPMTDLLLPAVVFLSVYVAAALASSLNLGLRHILPVFPFLLILAAASTQLFRGKMPHMGEAALVLLLVGHGATALRAHPHYLSYFNVFVGGPSQSWRYLSDSNVDWGQDLIHLRRYLDRHPALLGPEEPLKLSYFGVGDPSRYLNHVEMMPSSPAFLPDVVSAMAPELDSPPWAPVTAGLYAISATQLTGLYLPIFGPWNNELESRFEAGRDALRAIDAAGDDAESIRRIIIEHRLFFSALYPPEMRSAFLDAPDTFRDYWEPMFAEAERRHTELGFLKLLLILRDREPLARVGNSIYLYRVTEQDVSQLCGRNSD